MNWNYIYFLNLSGHVAPPDQLKSGSEDGACAVSSSSTITEEPGSIEDNPLSPLSPADPRILTFGFTDETLVQLGTKKLNKMLKTKGIIKDDATTIKQR